LKHDDQIYVQGDDMFGLRAAVLLSLVTAFAMSSASCAAGGATPSSPVPEQSVADDPALRAAAESARPWLEQLFADSFAGLELDHQNHVMIIYRRADPRLDAEVATRVRGVRIDLRDAKHSLAEMRAAIDRLYVDERYWRGRGLTITGAAPAENGSGVNVMTSGEPHELSSALAARYPGMSFAVRQQSVIPPVYTGSPPVWGNP
jgi:hypothetical protein